MQSWQPPCTDTSKSKVWLKDQHVKSFEPRWSRGLVSCRHRIAPRQTGKVAPPHPVYFSGHGSDVTHPGPSRTRGFHALISYATCRLRRPPESYSVRFPPSKPPILRKRPPSAISERGKQRHRGRRRGSGHGSRTLPPVAISRLTCAPV